MSAPDTNTETQERRHKPALLGIKGAMLFGALMMLGLGVFVLSNTGDTDAITNVDQANDGATVAPTDVYEPGTNATSTPTAVD